MLQRYFNFKFHQTSYRQETVAGLTTFLATAYIIVVNPAILEAAGIPRGPSITATILSAVFGTLVMGIYAKRPFAIAPYMGENAFIAYTVVKGLGLPWQTALGAIFIAGVLFTILTVLKVRSWMVNAIPLSLRLSFTVGIGLFLAFIGLNECGVVVPGVPGAPVALGAMSAPPTLLAIGGFFLTVALVLRRVTFALLVGILAVTGASMLLGLTAVPHQVFSLPASLSPILGQLDIAGALSWKSLPVVVLIFIMAFLDTIGTLMGLSARAGLLDAQGNLPQNRTPHARRCPRQPGRPLARHHHLRRLHRIRRRHRGRRPNGLCRPRRRRFVSPGALLHPHAHAGARLRLWAGPRADWCRNARPRRQNQFPRPD